MLLVGLRNVHNNPRFNCVWHESFVEQKTDQVKPIIGADKLQKVLESLSLLYPSNERKTRLIFLAQFVLAIAAAVVLHYNPQKYK